MPARLDKKRHLVARPDRADFRDRQYNPPLRSLPDQYPPDDQITGYLADYVKDDLIRDQGEDGACTGFGLAAVVNYTYWSRWKLQGAAGSPPPRVSPHMLYRNARLYDEWEGSDYEGSSCRGAMKGWYKHGICVEPLWESIDRRPGLDWATDAALRPLGSYYRVDSKSIAEMQAAIFEVQAIYCSATVHSGWRKPVETRQVGGQPLACIELQDKEEGGHAFALVGYTRDGFIVQNSWGTDWGTKGFALLSYEDWIKNGYDAWVAALGAPMRVGTSKGVPTGGRGPGLMQELPAFSLKSNAAQETAALWDESTAYDHAIVLGNDGKLLQRLVYANSPSDALQAIVEENVFRDGLERVAVYVHGGLNDEDAAIRRVRRLGPWFKANGIHPLFVVWRTGVMEAIGQIGLDQVKEFEDLVKKARSRGLGDVVEQVIATAREAFDRAFEVTAEKFIGKAVWSQMKQNAAMSSAEGGGIAELVNRLSSLKTPVHLLGHSAGSIMIGHMLDAAAKTADPLRFASCGLYAPACTMAFAAQYYGRALDNGSLAGGLHVDLLTDKAETGDTVGPYGKSLLYLVSRALEDVHKMPLFGLEIAHRKSGKGDTMELNTKAHAQAIEAWSRVKTQHADKINVDDHSRAMVKTGPKQTIPIAHGSFDNDIDIVNASLRRILGRDPAVPISDLTGF